MTRKTGGKLSKQTKRNTKNPEKGTEAYEKMLERQRARREVDKRDTGQMTKTLANGKRVTSKSPKRVGKDVSHNKALSKGGTNADGVKIEESSKNRARNYKKKTAKKKTK